MANRNNPSQEGTFFSASSFFPARRREGRTGRKIDSQSPLLLPSWHFLDVFLFLGPGRLFARQGRPFAASPPCPHVRRATTEIRASPACRVNVTRTSFLETASSQRNYSDSGGRRCFGSCLANERSGIFVTFALPSAAGISSPLPPLVDLFFARG